MPQQDGKVRLIRDSEYTRELLGLIRSARRRIEASVFLMDPGEGPEDPVKKIFDALAGAKKRRVQVLLRTSKIFEKKPSGLRLARLTRRLGLSLEWTGHAQFLHEKSVTIDGKIRLLGSHNWSAASLLENRELTVRFNEKIRILAAPDFRRAILEAMPLVEKEITLATYDIADIASNDSDFADLVARQLIFARMKKRKVRVILDASPSRSSGGKDLILYRGRATAEALAHQGVHVYYDTTGRLFHVKALVIDDREIFIGSQNIYPSRPGELEQTAHLKSTSLSAEVKTYLAGVLKTAERFRYDPRAREGVKIPAAWIRKGGALARLFQTRSGMGLKLLLALLYESARLKSTKIPWEEKRLAPLCGFRAPRRFTRSVKNRAHYFQRLLTQPRILLRRRGLLKYQAGPHGTALETVTLSKKCQVSFQRLKPGTFLDSRPKDFCVLPYEFWTYGWAGRLSGADIYNYLIHLAEVARSAEAPVWSMRARSVPHFYGISWQRFSKHVVRLERANLMEVTRDPKIVVPDVPKKANRYRINALWSEEEFGAGLEKLKKEFFATEKQIAQARAMGGRLNQPYDIDVIRMFLTLIERYGPAKVRRALAITARFAHNFALRNVHHTAAILRNWSIGINKAAYGVRRLPEKIEGHIP